MSKKAGSPDDLEKEYDKKLPLLAKAEQALLRLLNGVAASIEDKQLVRAEIKSPRIKSLTSLEAKAQSHGWSTDDAFHEASDLIGGRVVCNNVEDVYRFVELLKEALGGTGHFEVEDLIAKPKGGYRALHVNVRLPVGEYPFQDVVPMEIQIRTRLQDAWAELVHDDIYKNQDIPEDLRAMADSLATMLEATDKIASDIRKRVTRHADVAKKYDPSKLSTGGMAYLYADVFGNAPAEYVASEAVALAKSVGLKSLEPLRDVLSRGDYREKLSSVYRKHLRLPASVQDVFLACIVAAAKGDKRGLNWLERRAKREADEMQAFYEREVLAELPETIEELLEDPRAYINENTAGVLGATDNCAICGETIIHADSTAEALVHYYKLDGDAADEAYQKIEEAINTSDLETGGWNSSILCRYHDDRSDKD